MTNAIAPIKSVPQHWLPVSAGQAPFQGRSDSEDRVEIDPKAGLPEPLLNLNLEEFRANQGAVTSMVGVGEKMEQLANHGDSGSLGNASRQLGKAAGPLSTVFGAKAAADGIKQMKEGKVAEGGVKTAEGSTTSASGAATAVKSLADGGSTAAKVAGKVGGPLGAVGAGIGAAKDLEAGLDVGKDGLRVKDGEKVATGGAKAVSAGLLGAGVVCPPAALAGAALMAGTTIYENREAIGNGLEKVGGGIKKLLS